jgi:RNA polymerase sigma-70 factor, ECF subfamily
MAGSLPRSRGFVGDEPADEELVERVRVGDPVAFDALVSRHMPRAFRIAYRLLQNREDAEDLVQDSFLAVLEKIGSFQQGRVFTPWFHRIVVNRGLNARESRSVRTMEQIPETVASREISPARHAEQVELRDRIDEAIAALPERQKTIVQLFELEGFSGAEIADMLEISAGTVRWHLHEARRALREALAPLERKDER